MYSDVHSWEFQKQILLECGWDMKSWKSWNRDGAVIILTDWMALSAWMKQQMLFDPWPAILEDHGTSPHVPPSAGKSCVSTLESGQVLSRAISPSVGPVSLLSATKAPKPALESVKVGSRSTSVLEGIQSQCWTWYSSCPSALKHTWKLWLDDTLMTEIVNSSSISMYSIWQYLTQVQCTVAPSRTPILVKSVHWDPLCWRRWQCPWWAALRRGAPWRPKDVMSLASLQATCSWHQTTNKG